MNLNENVSMNFNRGSAKQQPISSPNEVYK